MKIALLYIKGKTASNVYNHIEAFKKYSVNDIFYIEVFTQKLDLKMLNQFDLIIIHYTIAIFSEYMCPALLKLLLRRAKGKKVVFIQDEFRVVNDVVANLAYLKAELLFTGALGSAVEEIYPAKKLPSLKKISIFAGFVPENLLNIPLVPYDDRLLDVVYRAHKLPAWLGRSGQDKWLIAERFTKDSKNYALKVDISYNEKDRIYGQDWVRVLQSSKATIGCEGGASVVDFTGKIQINAENYEEKNPDASFKDIEEKFFKGLDGKVTLNQITPRCFECAALGTLMILYEGYYSGVLIPWRHYIPLKRDHSNMGEVISFIKNPQKWEIITKQAYEEIALNPKYSHRTFIKFFDDCMAKLVKEENIFERKINFLLPNEPDFNFVKSCYIKSKIIPLLIYFLRHFMGSRLLDIFKNIRLCFKTFFILLKNYKLRYLFFSIDKNFCIEYKKLCFIKNYIYEVVKKIEINLISKIYYNEDCELEIYLDPDNEQNKAMNLSNLIKKARNIKFVFTNSWGIPESIRGKTIICKHVSLVKDILYLL